MEEGSMMMAKRTSTRRGVLAGSMALAGAALARPALAAAPARLRMAIFAAPSLGAFLPPIIKAQGFDGKNGLEIDFAPRTPDAYTTEFNTGEFQLGGSAAPLTIGIADARGVKVTYLFNLFDYWGAVVTSRPEIKTVKDLEGKELAAASGTTNFAMFLWFARRMGADPRKFEVVNTTPPGLITYAIADRAAAVELWEPAYTILKARKPGIRRLDLELDAHWKAFAGSTQIPYLGVAAQQGWVAKNAALVPKLLATYRDAAAWLTANPEPGARLISPRGNAVEQQAITSLVRANERLRMNVRAAGALRGEIDAVYRAGLEIAYLPKMPSPATIYGGTAG
jgi:ABC-type nitrate/sulfonate/bicarbonate transport system substrate-binding protein